MDSFSVQRILVLDDDKIQHLLLQKQFFLVSEDIEMRFFENAVEALDYLKDNPVNLIISDLNLGVMDGWEFVDELEKIHYAGKLFFLTGSIVPDERRRAEMDPRVSGFFEKPVLQKDLHQMLNG